MGRTDIQQSQAVQLEPRPCNSQGAWPKMLGLWLSWPEEGPRLWGPALSLSRVAQALVFLNWKNQSHNTHLTKVLDGQ